MEVAGLGDPDAAEAASAGGLAVGEEGAFGGAGFGPCDEVGLGRGGGVDNFEGDFGGDAIRQGVAPAPGRGLGWGGGCRGGGGLR